MACRNALSYQGDFDYPAPLIPECRRKSRIYQSDMTNDHMIIRFTFVYVVFTVCTVGVGKASEHV